VFNATFCGIFDCHCCIVNIVMSGYRDSNDTGTVHNVCSTSKFQDALMKHQEAAQRHLNVAKEDNVYCTTSDDDDDDDNDDDADDKDVFKTLVKSFNLPSGTLIVILLILSLVTKDCSCSFASYIWFFSIIRLFTSV